jgi:2-phosphoglycerate kinase
MSQENQGGSGQGGKPARDSGKVVVEDAGGPRPFMRGILIHSLLSRGISFDDAYAVSSRVRGRLRGRTVTREELGRAVAEDLRGAGLVAELPARPLSPDIAVVHGGEHTPFSKGILSQSLLAAALEPSEAWDVARRIEQRLARDGLNRVERRELRRLVYETLASTVGQRTAHRYLVWRHFQNPERPALILLGGATGVGKTSLALEVAHRLGIGRVMSTDSIRQVMRLMLSPALAPTIHSSSYEAWKAPGFEPTPGADPVVEAFAAQASVVSVGVRAMLDRAVDESLSVVLDGVSLLPGRLNLDAYANRAHVVFLIVATFDADAFRSRFTRRAEGQKARAPHHYLENLEAILRIQDYILDLAEAHGVPIVENVSFDETVLSIVRQVTETLGKVEGFDVATLL